jgi:hypothetical protein
VRRRSIRGESPRAPRQGAGLVSSGFLYPTRSISSPALRPVPAPDMVGSHSPGRRDVHQNSLMATLLRLVSASDRSRDLTRRPGPHPMTRTRPRNYDRWPDQKAMTRSAAVGGGVRVAAAGRRQSAGLGRPVEDRPARRAPCRSRTSVAGRAPRGSYLPGSRHMRHTVGPSGNTMPPTARKPWRSYSARLRSLVASR